MSPTAVNYDSNANVNSNTWCVEPVTGCMMPGVTEPSSGFITSKYIGRYGFSYNYNSHATVDFKCFGTVVGCLNPEALNFNCSSAGSSNCTDSVTGAWTAENGTGIPWFTAGTLCTPDDCTAVADKFPGAVAPLAPEGSGYPSFCNVLIIE